MNNCIVLGSGRSGTSALMGTLRNSGYYIGDDYLPKNESNPKGFFEDYEVNTINEDILAMVENNYPELIRRIFFKSKTFYRARWLARVPLGKKIPTTFSINSRIEKVLSNKPYCLKDPRFSYTFPIWEPFFSDNTKLICVFREPYNTATSILTECRQSPALHKLKINKKISLEIWLHVYQNILYHYKNSKNKHEWLFIHYDQLMGEAGLNKIEKITGAQTDRNFPEKKINRTRLEGETLTGNYLHIYGELCRLAAFQ